MIPENQKFSHIEEYLNGTLSEAQSLEFEEMLKKDSELREEVFYHKVTNESIIEGRYFEMTKNFKDIPVSKVKGNPSWLKRVIGISAGAGVIIAALLYFLNDSPTENSVSIHKDSLTKSNSQEPEVKEPAVMVDSVNNLDPKKKEPIVDNVNVPKEQAKKKDSMTSSKEKKDRTFLLEIPIDDPSSTHEVHAFSFNPDKGEHWEFPLNGRMNGDIKILDKSGKIVFNAEIKNGNPHSWNGLHSDGSKLESNTYTYLLDFSNGEVDHGRVTIKKDGKK